MQKHALVELAGWYGMVAILSALFLISFGYLHSTSSIYQILNISGAACLALNTCINKAYAAMWLNIIYALIATVALIKILI